MTDATFSHATARPSFFSRLALSLKQRNERKRTRLALESLSDRDLDDIGITRGDINDVIYGRR